jgi:heterodisulfide reductase subunit C
MSEVFNAGTSNSLAGMVNDSAGVLVSRCYQCGKCSAGCPACSEMDIAPSVLLRMLQLQNSEYDRKVLNSYSIWLCLTCHTCIARCPMEVDLPKVMDVLRAESLRLKLVNKRAKDIVAFHRSFIDIIRNFGRLWEIGLIADYKLRTRHFWQDVAVAPAMLKKGKLSLVPLFHKEFVERIFFHIRRWRQSQ